MATVIALIAFVVALLAVAYSWKLNQELATASRRLDRYNKALFDATDEVRRLREQMAEETARLRVDLRRQSSPQSGGSVFTPDLTVRETLMLHPQAEQVLAGFHLGGCSHCAVEPDETLAQACAQHGIDVQALMGNLNMLTQAPVSAGTGPQLVKLPNVALEL
jgi:hybrid cluster-associated redox disulfide protein